MSTPRGKQERKAQRDAIRKSITCLSDDELFSMRKELVRELDRLGVARTEVKHRLDMIKDEMNLRRGGMPAGTRVSDHAVIRYLERHKGVDVLALREEIATIAKRAVSSDPSRLRFRDEETGLTICIDSKSSTIASIFSESEEKMVSPNET